MSSNDSDEINRLILEFVDLQETWERDPAAFDWALLQALARRGAHAYNEDAGPSFHALAIDAVVHGEFHERFLAYLLQADFDPFKLARPGTGVAAIPVIDHAALAEATDSNASSARMRAALMEVARRRFAALALDAREGKRLPSDMLELIEACAESIPLDLLQHIAPELAKEHHGEVKRQSVDPTEAYLSPAEFLLDASIRTHG
ncbi:MAG TPA: hypothetical protein VJ698_10800 [Noviherbaspirillum sp.]|uniref:hypothetical protein n=1 Tax=Noviherbaspirillum sp. TaxID=1926288 RepID=UPI002B473AAF|nr:hypothetical protein [Noviherbaspirillum sp.]HJV85954.1 hypothetical protein [Noviherbaspirillum sp.]